MEDSKKAFFIIGICIILIGVFSAFILYKSLRPGRGLPYEQITMEQAAEYMSYEAGYLLLDVRTQEEYAEGHIPGAICIPNEEIEYQAEREVRKPHRNCAIWSTPILLRLEVFLTGRERRRSK